MIEKKATRGERCYAAMNRVMQVLMQEFEDLGPPETVFVLTWLRHRYLTEVDAIVHEEHERSQQKTADTCAH